jgi:predicted transcriptional regulator
MKEYLSLVEEGKEIPRPFYALSTQGYENLSNNMADLKRYLNNIMLLIKYYREYDKENEDE